VATRISEILYPKQVKKAKYESFIDSI